MINVDQVVALVEAYGAQSVRDQRAKEQVLSLLKNTPSPFSRHQFEPGHITVSAIVLSQDKERMLLILHRKLKLWLQPGGHLEGSDEAVLHAARRELEEETSLKGAICVSEAVLDIDVHHIPAGKEPAHQHFDLRFAFVATSDEIVAGSDVSDACWYSRSQMSTVITDESVRLALGKF